MNIRLRTNAKLNLFLRVAGLRADGYHELESIFHGVTLGDDLSIAATLSDGIEVSMHLEDGLRGEMPAAGDNLVTRAARALTDRVAVPRGARIEIEKRIPIGSGLGGGSANAAGTLVGLSDLWDLALEGGDLARVAAAIGSDVPYSLSGGTALVLGRGENVTPLPAPQSLWFVLGLSFDPLSTARVYAEWDEVGATSGAGNAAMGMALGSGAVDEIGSLLHNDLEAAALSLRPGLRDKKESLLEAGVLGAALSGSGPTLFGLARDSDHAGSVADLVRGSFDAVRVVTSAPRAVEVLA